MKAINNLIEMCWDDKKPKGGDLRAAERELEAIQSVLYTAWFIANNRQNFLPSKDPGGVGAEALENLAKALEKTK